MKNGDNMINKVASIKPLLPKCRTSWKDIVCTMENRKMGYLGTTL